MTYEEAHKSPLPAAYVTFQFGGNDFNNHQEFTVGDGVQSNGKIRSKRSNGEEYYYNRPLHPNTNYRVFLRAFVTEVFWSTDLSPPKIMQHYNTKDERRIFYLKAQYILNVVVTSRCFHSKLRLCHAPFPHPHPHPLPPLLGSLLWKTSFKIKCFSIECRKAKSIAITTADQKKKKLESQENSKLILPACSSGKY